MDNEVKQIITAKGVSSASEVELLEADLRIYGNAYIDETTGKRVDPTTVILNGDGTFTIKKEE